MYFYLWFCCVGSVPPTVSTFSFSSHLCRDPQISVPQCLSHCCILWCNMILLLGLLCAVWVKTAWSHKEDGSFSFEGNIQQVAVATNSVYIATEEKLYQLSHDLTLLHSLTQRGILKDDNGMGVTEFHRISETDLLNAKFSVNILIPFARNDTVVSCGVTNNYCGYCEILDLKNINKLVYSESIQVGPLRSSSGSVSFLVDVKKNSGQTETYILTAIKNHTDKTEEDRCGTDLKTINLHNTDHRQHGEIFSWSDHSGDKPGIQTEADVDFVDGFQINSTVYLFSNVASGGETNKVRLIWLQAETSKSDTLKSLHGATLSSSGGEGSRLLASSVVPGGQQVLWSGVFSVDEGGENTELLLFDISPDLSMEMNKDPDFFYTPKSTDPLLGPNNLKPKVVLLKHNDMTSVLAMKQKAWMVFFIGTADGLLMKLAVDRNFKPTCPEILYRESEKRKVFPKIHLDQVDQNHVYLQLKNKIERVAVSRCSTHRDVRACLSAQDPLCVWCVSEDSCTFEDHCTDSEWFSIPDEPQQEMISHRVVKDSSGMVKVIIQTHLTVPQKVQSNFTCEFSSNSSQICRQQGFSAEFPQCTCILINTLLTDVLDVTININVGKSELTEQRKLINCSSVHGQPSSHLCRQCIRSGCQWMENSCSWASELTHNTQKDVCLEMEAEMNISTPDVVSITPSVVSLYGKNHALLSGQNLSDVIGVRISTHMDCSPQESPVWNNTGVSLTFHIPTTETRRVVKVCVLLPDGSCHGNATVTYQPLPVCTDIVPRISWRSGKRKVKLIGTHLEFVDGLMQSHAQQQVLLPRNSSSENLIYDTPTAENSQICCSTVFLKVANQTVACLVKLTYLPDPEFTSFTTERLGNDVRVVIHKSSDKLEMTAAELLVWGVEGEKQHPCVKVKENHNKTDSFICDIQGVNNTNFRAIKIKYGGTTVFIQTLSSLHLGLLILHFLLKCSILTVLVVFCQWQKRQTSSDY
ncbi:plexin-C1-like [Poecilia formosa]|uniref:plexin-C1-like n=1 Tax=Poecilia formosa TaxID=48698 RepID=UPI0007BA548D|nr:PREDICTED: plexin-C1-like [Poecilia formosa]